MEHLDSQLNQDFHALAKKIEQAHLTPVAVFLLESMYPLRTLMNTSYDAFSPLLRIIGSDKKLKILKSILNSPDSYQDFLSYLEKKASSS